MSSFNFPRYLSCPINVFTNTIFSENLKNLYYTSTTYKMRLWVWPSEKVSALHLQDINISFRADLQAIYTLSWEFEMIWDDEVLSSSSLFPKFFLADKNKKLMSLCIIALLICFKLSNTLFLKPYYYYYLQMLDYEYPVVIFCLFLAAWLQGFP